QLVRLPHLYRFPLLSLLHLRHLPGPHSSQTALDTNIAGGVAGGADVAASGSVESQRRPKLANRTSRIRTTKRLPSFRSSRANHLQNPVPSGQGLRAKPRLKPRRAPGPPNRLRRKSLGKSDKEPCLTRWDQLR